MQNNNKTQNWKEQFNYRKKSKKINVLWGEIEAIGTIDVPIENIRARIFIENGFELKTIQETPHYQWINDVILNNDTSISFNNYYNYINKYFNGTDMDAHIKKMKELIGVFKREKIINPENITINKPKINFDSQYNIIIHDGLHRLSMAKSLGGKNIKCHIIKEKKFKLMIKKILNKLKTRYNNIFSLSDKGERIDIVYKNKINKDKLDMYQKSHMSRYEYAVKLIENDYEVADLACGTGYGSVILSQKAKNVTGVDINSKVIEKITKRYKDIPNVKFLSSDILKIEFKQKFDYIVSFETVEHLPEKKIEKIFSIFNEALKSKGKLIFSVPYMQEKSEKAIKMGFHLTFDINEEKIKKWLKSNGFEIESFKYQNYDTHKIEDILDKKDFIICTAIKK